MKIVFLQYNEIKFDNGYRSLFRFISASFILPPRPHSECSEPCGAVPRGASEASCGTEPPSPLEPSFDVQQGCSRRSFGFPIPALFLPYFGSILEILRSFRLIFGFIFGLFDGVCFLFFPAAFPGSVSLRRFSAAFRSFLCFPGSPAPRFP